MILTDSPIPLIMGIVNITPDSFYDGGRCLEASSALAHMENLTAQGADILDIGAASSRPGHIPVSVEEELARLAPFFSLLQAEKFPCLSIDTDKPQVAQAALEHGFGMINATGAPDAQMMRLAAEYDVPLVIMFKGPFSTNDVIEEIKCFFVDAVKQAEARGITADKLILDPGIGFNMTAEQCLHIVANTRQLTELGYPILIGLSNKRFLGGEPDTRGAATVAADLFAAMRGAAILRVHDVAAAASSLALMKSLQAAECNF